MTQFPPPPPRRSLPPALPRDHRGAQIGHAIRDNLALLFGAVAVAWMLEIVDLFLLGSLDGLGIRPRQFSGLAGVALAPLLHQGFGHLLSNTVPFLVLGGVVLIGGRRIFLTATIFILAVGGGALWTLGPAATNHIGASLLVFGYLGFLLARGVVEKSPFWIVVSLAILVVYGGMLAGVLPGQQGVSWQGHLFGFVAGAIAARVIFTRPVGASG